MTLIELESSHPIGCTATDSIVDGLRSARIDHQIIPITEHRGTTETTTRQNGVGPHIRTCTQTDYLNIRLNPCFVWNRRSTYSIRCDGDIAGCVVVQGDVEWKSDHSGHIIDIADRSVESRHGNSTR